jgi:hypothetical protein
MVLMLKIMRARGEGRALPLIHSVWQGSCYERAMHVGPRAPVEGKELCQLIQLTHRRIVL